MENVPKYKKKMRDIIKKTGVGVEKKGRQGEKSENVCKLFCVLLHLLLLIC